MFPLDALQITPNVAVIVLQMQFLVDRFASQEVILELIILVGYIAYFSLHISETAVFPLPV